MTIKDLSSIEDILEKLAEDPKKMKRVTQLMMFSQLISYAHYYSLRDMKRKSMDKVLSYTALENKLANFNDMFDTAFKPADFMKSQDEMIDECIAYTKKMNFIQEEFFRGDVPPEVVEKYAQLITFDVKYIEIRFLGEIIVAIYLLLIAYIVEQKNKGQFLKIFKKWSKGKEDAYFGAFCRKAFYTTKSLLLEISKDLPENKKLIDIL
ncbi:MAG: hypothetical protein Q3983_05640 [Capnocytophaga sp.]|nr:hypothetical protein [Capnocytophaga sp.]